MKKKSAYFPVAPQDSLDYLVGKYLANNQISYILKLKGKVNETILKHAIRLSLDTEPILGCRLIENDNNPVWELRGDLDEIELCSVIETEMVDAELQKFIGASYDFVRDCQVKVRILRAESDTICIKINHACSDAGGLRRYINLLTTIYDLLLEGQQYSVESRSFYSREKNQISYIPNLASILGKLSETESIPISPTLAFPCDVGENKEQALILKSMNSMDHIADYAHENDATVNDVLLTAFNRSISKIAQIQNKTISVYLTMDLRRYLTNRKAEAICNLSAMLPIMLRYDSTESFEATLSKLLIETRNLKRNHSGIKRAFLVERDHEKLGFRDAAIRFQQRRKQAAMTGLCIPVFSNVGVMPTKTKKFGLVDVAECYMIGPALFSPNFIMSASTYDNKLTLIVNLFQSARQNRMIENFMDTMLNELRTCV